MRTRCPLCRRSLSGDTQRWCRCGKTMDSDCYHAHDDWCAVDGAEAWIGALER
ncbi:hypothetical protein [Natrinema halophilum]|uniref:Uncharacterized protein n=1 Tax=Natrinema halophilum TaxID=1699371 RepID=A0A7D5GUR1_9EURY|nr:hypothetical protein [Natrinema halophilum]QLG50306.1 hypothetical protein HYG82_16385 [Natrinema halophilum]